MSLLYERGFKLYYKPLNETEMLIGSAYYRIVQSSYTYDEIVARIPSQRTSIENLHLIVGDCLDFTNWGCTSAIPFYYGDPRTSPEYSQAVASTAPYSSFITYSSDARSGGILAKDDDGNYMSFYFGSGIVTARINNQSYSSYGTSIPNTPPGMWLRAQRYIVISNIVKTSDGYLAIFVVDNSYSGNKWEILKTRFNLTDSAIVLEWLAGLPPVIPPGPEPTDDPYGPGGYSTTGGGGGTFDTSSDTIGLPSLPTLSFAATGFCRVYNPTLSQLQALSNYMWTDTTFLQTVTNHLKQLLENPIDAIISLSVVPVAPYIGTSEEVKVMYIPTGVSMSPVLNQFKDIDCGYLTIPRAYGSALDFNPYTSIDLFLPFIGQVTLDADEVMYKTLHCIYRVDVVTGSCVATILANDDNGAETALYQFSGECAVFMPLNSADFSGYIGAAISATKMIAGLAAAGAGADGIAAGLIGGPAPSTTATMTDETTKDVITTRNPNTGRQVTAWTSTTTKQSDKLVEHSGASFGELSTVAVANTVDSVMASKLHVQHSSGFAGTSGYLGVRRPYAIIKRPNQCYPENYASWNGFPSMITMLLRNCSGYTRIQSVHLTGFSATNPELSEISELLKTGVIF